MNRYAILLGKEPTEQEQKDSLKFNLARSEAMNKSFKELYGAGEPSDQSVFFQEFQYGQRARPDITELIPARSLSAEQAHILAQGMSRLSREAGIAIIVSNQRIGRVQNWEPSGTVSGRNTARWPEPPGGRALHYPSDIHLQHMLTRGLTGGLTEEQRQFLSPEPSALPDFSPLEQRILGNPGF